MNERYGEKLKSIEASINELIEQYEKRNRFTTKNYGPIHETRDSFCFLEFFLTYLEYQSWVACDVNKTVDFSALERTGFDLEFLKIRISGLNWIIR